MDALDEECETVFHAVSNYHFVDENEEPISFAELPIQWYEDESNIDENKKQIFLHGDTDNGLQKLYKQVTALKFDLSNEKPEIRVRTKENRWIELQKPRKSFEAVIRTILITIYSLQFVKHNPKASGKSMWDHLSSVFSLYDVRPSGDDLVDNMHVINEAVDRDESLKSSKILLKFLEEKSENRKTFDEVVPPTSLSGFIDDDTIEEAVEKEFVEEDDHDPVCALCDNGGDILCCDGECMRSFHATKKSGIDSACLSLLLTEHQVKVMENFFCKNCQYHQHQCFACGELGSSDKSAHAELIKCDFTNCNHFYHPQCAAKLLHQEDEGAAEELRGKVAAGESFICPIHTCCVCEQLEDMNDDELRFAVCRRCPTSYHKKCLPREICFEGSEEEGIIQRAWDGLLLNQILIYCLKHEMDKTIGTPIRNHIKFPYVEENKEIRAPKPLGTKKGKLKRKNLASPESAQEKTVSKVPKQVGGLSSAAKEGGSLQRIEKIYSADSPKNMIVKSTSVRSLADNNRSVPAKSSKLFARYKTKISLEDQLYATWMNNLSEHAKPKRRDLDDSDHEQVDTARSGMNKLSSSCYQLNAYSERRLLALMEESASSDTLKLDKIITQERLDNAVEALRTALQKIEAECCIENVKDGYEPETPCQIVKWKNKLKIYLAPFLHGLHYSTFDHHYLKVDKLREIVEKLHEYVKSGDTIVDFCCGNNEFSCVMKRKLQGTGKECLYKNYDILSAANDFNFEQRDWLEVQPKELPIGSQLIMGLTPPFGDHGSLANKFIDKALKFKPKLLVLIVPQEIESLDKKITPYSLIWKDDDLLSGESFNLPGCIDENAKMGQCNKDALTLHIWSRRDWTAKHKAIAKEHGHLSRRQSRPNTHVRDYSLSLGTSKDDPSRHQSHHDAYVPDYSLDTSRDYHPLQSEEQEVLITTKSNLSENHREGSPPYDNGDKGGHLNYRSEDYQFSDSSNKWRNVNNERTHIHDVNMGRAGPVHETLTNVGSGEGHMYMETPNKNYASHGRTRLNEVYTGTPIINHGISTSEALPFYARTSHINEVYTENPTVNHNRSTPAAPPFYDHGAHRNEVYTSTPTLNYSKLKPDALSFYNHERHMDIEPVDYQHPRPASGVAMGYNDSRTSNGFNLEQPYSSGPHRWPNNASPIIDPLEYYRRYTSVMDVRCERQSEIRANIQQNQRYERASEIRADIQQYGRYDDSSTQRGSYVGGRDPGFNHISSLPSTYGYPQQAVPQSAYGNSLPSTYIYPESAAAQSSYGRLNISATQQYAPRLDEVNHYPRMNYSEHDLQTRSVYEPPPRPPPEFGFAPGSYNHGFSQHNSSGWLND